MVLFDFNVFAIEPNFIAAGIAFKLNAFIISLLLKLLNIVEVFIANGYKLF